MMDPSLTQWETVAEVLTTSTARATGGPVIRIETGLNPDGSLVLHCLERDERGKLEWWRYVVPHTGGILEAPTGEGLREHA